MPDKPLHGPCSSITQSTYSVPFNLLCDFLKHINLLQHGIPHLQLLHNHPQPSSPLPARCALTTAFMLVEVRQPCYCIHNICGLVHHDHGCRTQSRLNSFESIIIHQDIITNVLGKERNRGTSWDDCQKVVPTSSNTTTMPLEQFLQWDAHLLLHRARFIHMTRNTE
ncbi:unnamed protein product [Musa acuminata var. zebrina]